MVYACKERKLMFYIKKKLSINAEQFTRKGVKLKQGKENINQCQENLLCC